MGPRGPGTTQSILQWRVFLNLLRSHPPPGYLEDGVTSESKCAAYGLTLATLSI